MCIERMTVQFQIIYHPPNYGYLSGHRSLLVGHREVDQQATRQEHDRYAVHRSVPEPGDRDREQRKHRTDDKTDHLIGEIRSE